MGKTSPSIITLSPQEGGGPASHPPPHLHEAEWEERLRLSGRSGVESLAPVGDECGEGAVVLVCVQKGVGLAWSQKQGVG